MKRSEISTFVIAGIAGIAGIGQPPIVSHYNGKDTGRRSKARALAFQAKQRKKRSKQP